MKKIILLLLLIIGLYANSEAQVTQQELSEQMEQVQQQMQKMLEGMNFDFGDSQIMVRS